MIKHIIPMPHFASWLRYKKTRRKLKRRKVNYSLQVDSRDTKIIHKKIQQNKH